MTNEMIKENLMQEYVEEFASVNDMDMAEGQLIINNGLKNILTIKEIKEQLDNYFDEKIRKQ